MRRGAWGVPSYKQTGGEDVFARFYGLPPMSFAEVRNNNSHGEVCLGPEGVMAREHGALPTTIVLCWLWFAADTRSGHTVFSDSTCAPLGGVTEDVCTRHEVLHVHCHNAAAGKLRGSIATQPNLLRYTFLSLKMALVFPRGNVTIARHSSSSDTQGRAPTGGLGERARTTVHATRWVCTSSFVYSAALSAVPGLFKGSRRVCIEDVQLMR